MTTDGRAAGPLSGIRVVSLEQYIAGPYCTSLLADAGAEVIKVERPGLGDPRRAYEPLVAADGISVSSGFVSYNRNKKSVTVDFSTAAGADSLWRLVESADVVVSNLRPGSLEENGFDAAALAATKPSLIICEISGFGTGDGPYASWPAFDSVIQAMCGLASLIGPDPASPPGLAPMGTIDLLTGVYAALGICMTLAGRSAGHSGRYIDVAMYDVGAAFLERPLTLYEMTGEVANRGVDRFSPVGVFRASDGGWIAIVIPTDEMWRRCCAAIGRTDLRNDGRLDTMLKRAAAMHEVIVPALESWASTLSRDEALSRLQASGQPAGFVQTIDEVRNCPQLAARGLFAPVPDPVTDREGGALRLPRLPILFSGYNPPHGRSPRLGEHNAEFGVPDASGLNRPGKTGGFIP